MRRGLALSFFALVLAASACGGPTAQPAAGPRSVAKKAPDFTVDLVSGERFRLADHVGKDVVVIDFWTTFCQPCVGALEHLQKSYANHKTDGLVVLGVSMDPPETAGQVPSFVRTHGLSFPVVHDADSRVTELYNKKSSAPFQVLIARDGSIVRIRETFQPGDEVSMESDIATALAAKLAS